MFLSLDFLQGKGDVQGDFLKQFDFPFLKESRLSYTDRKNAADPFMKSYRKRPAGTEAETVRLFFFRKLTIFTWAPGRSRKPVIGSTGVL
jgi:hypothetical protein